MNMLEEFYPEFTDKLTELDQVNLNRRPVSEKFYQMLCFALAVRGRSAEGARRHFRAAMIAGASMEEMNYILAVTMREAADAEERWALQALGDWRKLLEDSGIGGGKYR